MMIISSRDDILGGFVRTGLRNSVASSACANERRFLSRRASRISIANGLVREGPRFDTVECWLMVFLSAFELEPQRGVYASIMLIFN